MRVLVTGGLGVIGSSIARKLLAAGHEVAIVDAAEQQRNRWVWKSLPVGASAILYDHRVEEGVSYYVDKCDAVIHAAASTGIPWSVEHPDDDWRSNVDATRMLLEALRKHPVPTVVLSSVKPYRVDPLPAHGLDESVPLEPDEPYASSKATQSMLCMAYAKSYGLPVVTFRCSNLYGPAPCHGPRHGWLTWMCISAAIGRPLEVQGDGTQSRDMLHADDVYSACMSALVQAKELRGEVFNLGGGYRNVVSVGEVAKLLHELTGVEVKSGPARAMDDKHVFADTLKFNRATGWEPKVSVSDGIREVLAWAQANKAELAKLYAEVA
jgi:CDP-paratose 2-epimerase